MSPIGVIGLRRYPLPAMSLLKQHIQCAISGLDFDSPAVTIALREIISEQLERYSITPEIRWISKEEAAKILGMTPGR
ncbi:MAG: hypothetical protein AAGA67_14050, partial [Cyanobacteria bacterium P01_F01_bin.153]